MLFSVGVAVTFLTLATASTLGPTVKVNSTTVIGVPSNVIADNGNNISQFFGIPYAPKPVRFEKSVQQSFSKVDTFNATKYGPICNQEFASPSLKQLFFNGSIIEGEDCLSLNVWTPHKPGGELLPVLFWIYGGSFQFGGSILAFYEGSKLAARNTVVVTINYRTNIFGFPAASQIPITETNLGLFDQRVALNWVRQNIEAFGGDKNKITIFGESAGGVSVDSLVLSSDPEKPPFRAAIYQSGVSLVPSGVRRGTIFNDLAVTVGCMQPNGSVAQLQCMKEVSAASIVAAEEKIASHPAPIADNVTIFSDPIGRRLTSKAAKVPVIIGTNADEGTLFTAGLTDLDGYIAANYPASLVPQIKKVYSVPSEKYPTNSSAIAAIFGDSVIACPGSIVASVSAAYVGPTYRYKLAAAIPNLQLFPGAGAFHSEDLQLVFGSYPNENVTSQEDTISTYFQTIWTGFARNPKSQPWPPINSYPEDLGVIGGNGSSGVTMQSRSVHDSTCAVLWNSYLLQGRNLTTILAAAPKP